VKEYDGATGEVIVGGGHGVVGGRVEQNNSREARVAKRNSPSFGS
jgi:hypothetical protein